MSILLFRVGAEDSGIFQLMRSRPEIELHMPPVIHPGETVDARVVLHEATETPVNAIRVVLRAQERVPYGKEVVSYWALVETAIVAKDIRLTPGRYEYAARFTLPLDAPLSHVSPTFNLLYTVLVHVDIPWWPDARDTFSIAVAARQRPRPRPVPLAQTTAKGGDPFLELSLDDTIVEPGETLSGQIAAGHVDPATVKRIKLSLVIQEHAQVGRSWHTASRRYTEYFLPPGDVARGEPVRFNLRIPPGTPCAFETSTAKVQWWFEAELERRLRSDLSSILPLDIGAFLTPREQGNQARPLLGSDRWRQRWAAAGARFGLVLGQDELDLRGEVAGIEVEVTMHTDGLRFAINLRFPSLGIGLDVAHRRLPFGGIDVDDAVPTFGRRFRVNAREAAQARAILAVDVRRCLLTGDEARLGDTSAQVLLPGNDRDQISSIVDLADAFARAIARAKTMIPPPAAMTAFAPAWARYAESNQGVFSAGGMQIGASLVGAPFAIVTEFDDDKPIATRVSAKIDPPLAAAFDVDDAAELGTRPREVVAVVRELGTVGRVTVGEEKIELSIPRPLADPEEIALTIVAMFRLVALLQGRAASGPYR